MKRVMVWILILILPLIPCGCAAQTPSLTPIPQPTPTPQPISTVILDAGHGGIDKGCVGEKGTLESELNLDIVLRLEQYLAKQGVNSILTRQDESVYYDAEDPRTRKNQDMIHRAQIIRDSACDAVISIHMNRFEDPSVHGPQVFCKNEDTPSALLADSVQNSLCALPEVDKKRSVQKNDSLFILNACSCPSILVECGFLSHPKEEELLSTENYRQILAEAIGSAYCTWYKTSQAQGGFSHEISGD